MFKKPSRNLRQRRTTEDSNDEEDAEHRPAETAEPANKIKQPITKEIPKASGPLLSFEDDAEDVETAFKVKRSKASQRFAKTSERDKFKQAQKVETSEDQSSLSDHAAKSSAEKSRVDARSAGTLTNTKKQQEASGNVTKRAVVDDDVNVAERFANTKIEEDEAQMYEDELRRLNAEADDGPASGGTSRLRGGIPDATFISFAKLQRQIARNKEGLDDGQPAAVGASIKPEYDEAESNPSDRKFEYSDDERHRADDDDDEEDANIEKGGLVMGLNSAEQERKRLREEFLAIEQGSSDSHSGSDSESGRRRSKARHRKAKLKRDVDDEEMNDWEMQQIRKAVGRSRFPVANSQQTFGIANVPTAPGSDYPADYVQQARLWAAAGQNALDSTSAGQPTSSQRLEAVASVAERRSVPSLAELRSNMLRRLEDAETETAALRADRERCASEMERCSALLAKLDERVDELDDEYQFYQLHREFVETVLNCADAKIGAIVEREDAAFAVLRGRVERLARRRADDLNDQSNDLMAAVVATRGGASQPSASGTTAKELMDTELRLRRVAEREARRARRRKRREATGVTGHNEGMSTDDEESTVDVQKFAADKDAVLRSCNGILEDVDEQYQLVPVLRRHADWAARHSNTFQECFISDFVPKLIEPMVRLELIRFWFEFDSSDPRSVDDIVRLFSTQRWFVEVSKLAEADAANAKSSASTACFEKLLSECIEQVFIDSLRRFIDVAFEPLSTAHTRKLSLVLEYMLDRLGCNAHAKPFETLFDTLFGRFRKSVDEVFIPVLVNKSVAADERLRVHYAFLQRQFWSSAKLYTNVLSLARFVEASRTQSLIIDVLLNRYVMMAFQLLDATPNSDVYDRLDFVISQLPRNWLDSASANALSAAQRQPLIKFLTGLFDVNKTDKKLQKQFVRFLLKLGADEQAAAICTKYSL